jgi:hypothetical protein
MVADNGTAPYTTYYHQNYVIQQTATLTALEDLPIIALTAVTINVQMICTVLVLMRLFQKTIKIS